MATTALQTAALRAERKPAARTRRVSALQALAIDRPFGPAHSPGLPARDQHANASATGVMRAKLREGSDIEAHGTDGACPGCQAKSALTIGAPDDRFEQEADRTADAVMGASPVGIGDSIAPRGPQLRRKPLSPEDLPDSAFPGVESELPIADQIGAVSEAPVQRSTAPAAAAAGPAVTPHYAGRVHQAMASAGQGLPPTTHAFMGRAFGRDFSNVQIHHDARAAELAQQINARAFTIGEHIFFGANEYAPATNVGQRLLAHELTHVVQQSEARLSPQLRRTPCSSYPNYDSSIDRLTYNCSGLALRTYRFTSPPSAVYAEMGREFDSLTCPVGTCRPGQAKFWMWQYDIRTEDDRGTVVNPTWQDFHIVGGRMDSAGGEPNVYSKNGPRPIHGPASGPSFRPATRDRALDRDDNPGDAPNGRPLFKVRSNMREVVSCGRCR